MLKQTPKESLIKFVHNQQFHISLNFNADITHYGLQQHWLNWYSFEFFFVELKHSSAIPRCHAVVMAKVSKVKIDFWKQICHLARGSTVMGSTSAPSHAQCQNGNYFMDLVSSPPFNYYVHSYPCANLIQFTNSQSTPPLCAEYVCLSIYT